MTRDQLFAIQPAAWAKSFDYSDTHLFWLHWLPNNISLYQLVHTRQYICIQMQVLITGFALLTMTMPMCWGSLDWKITILAVWQAVGAESLWLSNMPDTQLHNASLLMLLLSKTKWTKPQVDCNARHAIHKWCTSWSMMLVKLLSTSATFSNHALCSSTTGKIGFWPYQQLLSKCSQCSAHSAMMSLSIPKMQLLIPKQEHAASHLVNDSRQGALNVCHF